MTQSMRLYKKVFTQLRWKKYFTQLQQLQSSSTESVFVYLCTCVFVYLFEKIFLNSTQVQQLQSTGRMWRHLSKLLHLLHSIHNQFCLISFCLRVISSHINIFTNIHTNIFTNIHTNIHTNIFTNIHTIFYKYSDKYWRRGSANLLHSLLAQFRPSSFVILSWTISFNTGFLP